MEQNEEKIIQETVEEFLKLLEVDASMQLERNDDVMSITLDTAESGMVIGYHGENLEALQLILSLVLSRKLGKFSRVSLEVGDYKKHRTEWLEQLTNQTKERVLTEKKEISLPMLKSWERRIVHLYLQEDKEVVTESVGAGKERTLVIKPR